MKKRILSIILVLALCLTLMPVAAFAAESGTSTDPWRIGKTEDVDNVTAYIENGTLHIEGSGRVMPGAQKSPSQTQLSSAM